MQEHALTEGTAATGDRTAQNDGPPTGRTAGAEPGQRAEGRVLYMFLDGIGLGANERTNPLAVGATPFLRSVLGRSLINGPPIRRPGLLLTGIDACLGVAGNPQSATGQTALFTGVNAAQELGYHHPAYPDQRLTAILNEHSILKQATSAGLRASFANAYTERYFIEVEQGRLAHSATTLAVLAAGLRFRMTDDLRRGNAVYWDITNHTLQAMRHQTADAPREISPETAGANLARLSRRYDLLLYECFAPDLIGHRRDQRQALDWLATFDRFLRATIKGMDSTTTLVLSSDHGNMERLDVVAHTRNPVPLLVIGPRTEAFEAVDAITGITPAILELLGTANDPDARPVTCPG